MVGLVIGLAGTLILLTPWTALAECTPPGCSDDDQRIVDALACLVASASYGVGFLHSPAPQHPRHATARHRRRPAGGRHRRAHRHTNRRPPSDQPRTAPLVSLLILGTGLAYVLNYQIINANGPTVASTVTYLLPVVAIVLGLVFLDGPFGWNLVVGTLTVLAGVVLVRQGSAASRPYRWGHEQVEGHVRDRSRQDRPSP
jgi:drug/metabolite transporter (DMT)-like permease